jgi:hypothetical protein
MSSAASPSADLAGHKRRWSLREGANRVRQHWPWIPVAFAAGYAVILVVTLRSVIAAIYVNADIASAPAMGELVGRAPRGAEVVLGNIPWYTALWFEELTHGLPLHRPLWELTPWVLGLIGIGLVGWATARVAGRWAGWIVAVTCGCAGAALLPLQFAWGVHAVSYVHIFILGAALVPLAMTPGWVGGRPWRHIALLALIAVLTGLGVASDQLVIVGGLVPFVVAGAVLAYVSPREDLWRVVGSVLSVPIIAAGVAIVVTHFANAAHIVPHRFPITFSNFNQLFFHVGDLLGSLVILGNGNFSGVDVSLTSGVAFVCAATVLLAVYVVLRCGRTMTVELGTRGHGEHVGQTRRTTAGMTFRTFWLTCALAVSVAFMVSSVPIGLGTSRYVVPVAYALVVIVVLSAVERPVLWRRALLVAGSSVVIAGSVLALVQRQIQTTAQPAGAVANGLLRFARANGLSVG